MILTVKILRSFTAQYRCSEGNLEFGQTSYNWNFGNGTSQSTTSTSINYAYPSAGTFTVSLSKGNPDYPSQSIQTQVVIYRQIGSVNSSVTGPTSYDVCNIAPPSQSTTLFTSFRMTGKLPTDAFNVVWEYQFNGGSWVQMSYTAGPISSTSIGAPTGFGDATITGTWTVRCTGQDACGNPNSASFNLSNYASNPLCSNH